MQDPDPIIRRADETESEAVSNTEGLEKEVLVGEADGAPNFAIRRFTIEPGGTVPEHTNAVEHEQLALTGEYVVGIEDTEYTVSAGDAIFLPAGTVHWYRNESDSDVAFVCAVPHGEDEIQLVD